MLGSLFGAHASTSSLRRSAYNFTSTSDSLYAHFAVTSSPNESTESIGGGAVAGIVIGILLFMILAVAAGVIVVWCTVIYIKGSKTKQLRMMQLDIMTV